jgi:hypothetical protein
MVLLHQSISRFCPSCFLLLLCQACSPKPLYPFVSLDPIKQLYLHVVVVVVVVVIIIIIIIIIII